MNSNKVYFDVESVQEQSNQEDMNFCTLKIDAFASGDNAHHLYVSDETLKSCADTIYDKPLLYKYNDMTMDCESHEPEEICCGFVNRENNPIVYRRLKDGRLMMTVFAKIWKYYNKNLIDIFRRDSGKKSVSVEMVIDDIVEKTKEIKKFCFNGITILGNAFSPAIPDAQAMVMQFSADKEAYYAMFENKNFVKIDNKKDSAINSRRWSNPGRRLYSRIIDSSNSESLAKEAYLIVEEGWKDAPSEHLKYPHHVIRDGKLVIDIAGIKSANARAQSQGVATGAVLEHIKRHYRELGLSMESFSITEQEASNLEKEKVMMEEVEKEDVVEEKEEVVEEDRDAEEVDTEEVEEDVDYTAKIAEYEAKIEEYACNMKKYEAELAELRKYKADREEQDKNYAMEQLMTDVAEYLPKEEVEGFREEAKGVSLENFAAFSNRVKARTLDFAKKTTQKTDIQVMSIEHQHIEEKENKWW